MFSIESFVRERDIKTTTVYQFNATRGTIVRVWANLNTHTHKTITLTHTAGEKWYGTCFGGANLTTTWTQTQSMCACTIEPTMCETVCIGKKWQTSKTIHEYIRIKQKKDTKLQQTTNPTNSKRLYYV